MGRHSKACKLCGHPSGKPDVDDIVVCSSCKLDVVIEGEDRIVKGKKVLEKTWKEIKRTKMV